MPPTPVIAGLISDSVNPKCYGHVTISRMWAYCIPIHWIVVSCSKPSGVDIRIYRPKERLIPIRSRRIEHAFVRSVDMTSSLNLLTFDRELIVFKEWP